jgi:hypothetical protein
MTVLNQSIPYTMRVQATKKNYNTISFDYFVGGYPLSSKIEIGSYAFYTNDTLSKSIEMINNFKF